MKKEKCTNGLNNYFVCYVLHLRLCFINVCWIRLGLTKIRFIIFKTTSDSTIHVSKTLIFPSFAIRALDYPVWLTKLIESIPHNEDLVKTNVNMSPR